MTPGELASLTDSWITHLEAERKSPHTIRTYTAGLAAFTRWCEREGRAPDLDRAAVEAFTADQVKAMLATCGTRDFHDIRDAAIIRLMTESMVRAGELLGMQAAEVNIREGSALVRRGKGGRGRVVPFGPQTGRALDRYSRARRRHPLAASPPYWLAGRGRVLTYAGLHSALTRRAERAGFTMHPHMLRATGAIRWRAAGGSVPGLLTVAGWSSVEMAARYVKAAENRLALDEAHRLDLGDL